MDNLADWKTNGLIPAIWNNIERAFPEFKFVKNRQKWVSRLHLDGSDSHSPDQTYIASRYGNSIHDNNGEHIGFIDYVMKRDNCDLMTAEKTLAAAVGISFPEREESEDWKVRRDIEQRERKNREEANRIYTAALFAKTEGANEVLNYLYGRGWTETEIRAAELGYIDEVIKAALPDVSDINFTLNKLNGAYTECIASTHRLTIPFRSKGEIIGFKFRNIRYDEDLAALRQQQPEAKIDKYLNSKGTWRSGHLFGLSPVGIDCIVVEGELDALHAVVKGAANVVATTGGAVTAAAVEDALRVGFKRFTLLFDNDERGRGFIDPSIRAIENAGASAWIAKLPDEVKDTDEFLKSHSVEDFNIIVGEGAYQAFYWKLYQVTNKYIAIEERNGGILGLKNREDFFTEVIAILNSPTMKPYDRQLLKDKLAEYSDSLNFTIKDFEAEADRDYFRKQEQQRTERIKDAGLQISEALKVGNVDEALKLMSETVTTATRGDKAQEYAKEFAPLKGSIEDVLAAIKEGIPTGYTFAGTDPTLGKYDEELTLNVGLTFIAAPTSHGKTSFLNNIALNVAEWNRQQGNGQTILYFSYEIDKYRLIANLLNTYVNDPELNKIGKPLNAIYDYGRGGESRFFTDRGSNGQFSDHYTPFLKKKAEFWKLFQDGSICISDTSHKAGALIEAIRYYLPMRKPTAIFIDYAQLIYDEDNKGLSRTEELKKIMNALKELTKEIQTPIVLAAQMKNDVTSPLDVTIDNVGESKDLAMIADTTIGLFNFAKLHDLTDKNKEGKLKKLIGRLTKWAGFNVQEEIKPIRNEIYAKIIKRRFGLSDIEQVLTWEGRTGRILPNKPEALKRKAAEQGQLFGDDLSNIPDIEEDCPF